MSADDYAAWQETAYLFRSPANVRRLLDAMDPFDGIGRPEPLKYGLPNAWSRRITDEHRPVKVVRDDDLVLLQARQHWCRCTRQTR